MFTLKLDKGRNILVLSRIVSEMNFRFYFFKVRWFIVFLFFCWMKRIGNFLFWFVRIKNILLALGFFFVCYDGT